MTADRNGARPALDGTSDGAPSAEETARAARGMAAQRRPGGGPPWANIGVPMEKASSFGPSVRRLLGRLTPERLGVVVVLVRGATDGWVPYGFLLPENGVPSLVLHVAGLLEGVSPVKDSHPDL